MNPIATNEKTSLIRERVKQIAQLFQQTFRSFLDDDGLRLSASLSYYTIFSIPPLLIIIISLCGFFFGPDAVRGTLFSQINGLVGNDAAIQIQEAIKHAKLSGTTMFATVIGLLVLIIGASGVFTEIQSSLNHIWGIRTKPRRGIIKLLKNRLMSFTMIGSVGILLLLALITNALMDLLYARITLRFPVQTIYVFYVFNLVIVFVVIMSLFTLIFKILPDGTVRWKDCMIGASFTALLFMLGKFVIGAYLSSSAISTVYGATGSVILILVWIYYSAIILYFGAEFMKVYANTHGSKIIPNDYSFQMTNRIRSRKEALPKRRRSDTI
jgi:membrane protein